MNPEFYRNILLELTLYRLVAMPLFLALAYAAAGLLGGATMVYELSWFVMMGLLVLMGTRHVADSVLGEITGRTWDSQRMSAAGPFSMSWSKLVGSTVFPWYGVALSIPAYVYQTNKVHELPDVFLTGLMAQAVAMFASLLVARSRPVRLRFQVTASQGLGVAAGFATWSALSGSSRSLYGYGELVWYGLHAQLSQFTALTVLAFLAWVCFGVYRLMRAELQFRCWPVGWTCFILYCVVFMFGFSLSVFPLIGVADVDRPGVETLMRMVGALVIVVGLVWVCAYIDHKGFVALRRWVSALQSRNPRRILETTPAWIPGLIIGIVLCLVFLAVWTVSDNASAAINYLWHGPSLGAFAIAMVLFLLRDIGLVHFLTLDARKRRAHMTAMIYFVVIYILFPIVVSSVGLEVLFPIFFPFPQGHPLLIVVPVLVQVGIVAALFFFRWKRVAASRAAD